MSIRSMLNFKRLPLICLSSLGIISLSACAGQQACDPSQTELFTGIACMSNGGYKRRADALQNEAQNAQQTAIFEREKAIKAQHDAALAQKHANVATASLNGRISKLQNQARNDQKQIVSLSRVRSQLLNKKLNEEAQLKEAQQRYDTAAAASTPDAVELANIKKKIEELKAQHNGTISDLAGSGN